MRNREIVAVVYVLRNGYERLHVLSTYLYILSGGRQPGAREQCIDFVLTRGPGRRLDDATVEMRREQLQEVVHVSAQQAAPHEARPRGVSREQMRGIQSDQV